LAKEPKDHFFLFKKKQKHFSFAIREAEERPLNWAVCILGTFSSAPTVEKQRP